MRAVIKKLIFLFITIFSFQALANCRLKTDAVVLSGPLLMLLEELDLIEPSKGVIGISALYKLDKPFKGRVLSGGMFMGKKEIIEFKNKTIFYDKSRELSRALKRFGIKKLIEFDSRQMNPFEFVTHQLEVLKPYTLKCEKKIQDIILKLKETQSLVSKNNKKLNWIFFIGKIKSRKAPPNLVMTDDGFVISLKKQSLFKTYESKLAYITWSQRELRKYSDRYIYLGLNDSKQNIVKVEKVASKTYNLFYRGVLIPGIRQVNFLRALLKPSFSFE